MRHGHVVGDLLRTIRIRAQMRQEDLAKKARLSIYHLSDIENDKTEAGDMLVLRVADALDVPVEAFTRPGERPGGRVRGGHRKNTIPNDEQAVA